MPQDAERCPGCYRWAESAGAIGIYAMPGQQLAYQYWLCRRCVAGVRNEGNRKRILANVEAFFAAEFAVIRSGW